MGSTVTPSSQTPPSYKSPELPKPGAAKTIVPPEPKVLRGTEDVNELPAPPARSPEQAANVYFQAFQKKDLAALEEVYAPHTTFDDPIYNLKGRTDTLGMWKSLYAAGKNLEVTYKILETKGDVVTVAWEANYEVFGRKVHNVAESQLKIENGQITKQVDSWSWSKWARQALPLGPLVDFPPVKAVILHFLRNS